MGKKIYKAESFKVGSYKDFAKELENFINEYAAQGWTFEQFNYDHLSSLSAWCHVLFSREEG